LDTHYQGEEDRVAAAFEVRRATVADVDIIAHHRAEMFLAMGLLPQQLHAEMVAATKQYLAEALPAEEYTGWLCTPVGALGEIVGGGGLLRRRVPPHALIGPEEINLAVGRQGVVLNVYTEPAWRRRGVAELIMRHILAWTAEAGLDTLVLHASAQARPIYERLGFVPANEMRYAGANLHRQQACSFGGGSTDC
jgi:GNAT superfamily N-acetyltransferase